MSDSLDDKKRHVLELISRGSEHKLMIGPENRKRAFDDFREAQQLAADLPSPWRGLVAYRLAHLHMRSGELTDEELGDVDQLFSQASRQAESLGPLPALYRLAVLARMENLGRDRLENARELALKKVRAWREREDKVTLRIQFPEFNMLEMLSYAVRLPYDGLEGLGADPKADPVRTLVVVPGKTGPTRQYWRRLGWSTPTRGANFVSSLAYSREFALEELEDEQVTSDSDIIFRCSEEGGKDCHWRTPQGDWVKDQLYVTLLALVVAGCSRRQFGQTSDTFRKRKSRLKGAIEELAGRSIRIIEDSDGLLRFPDDLRVAGAVSAGVLILRSV